MLSINGHIDYFLKMIEDGTRRAEAMHAAEEWVKIKPFFIEFSHKKFLTQYCQERMMMVNRFTYQLIPASHYQFTEANKI